MRDASKAPTAAGSPAPVDVERLVLAASRDAVTTMAPQELEVFDAVAAQWRRRVDHNDGSTPGGAVGFGIESALMTELIMQVVGAAIGEVFSVAARHAQSRWRRWRRRKEGPPAAPTTVPTVPSSHDVETRLREATQRHAIALGLSAGQAGLLADAVVGALRPAGQSATDEPRTGPTAGDGP